MIEIIRTARSIIPTMHLQKTGISVPPYVFILKASAIAHSRIQPRGSTNILYSNSCNTRPHKPNYVQLARESNNTFLMEPIVTTTEELLCLRLSSSGDSSKEIMQFRSGQPGADFSDLELTTAPAHTFSGTATEPWLKTLIFILISEDSCLSYREPYRQSPGILLYVSGTRQQYVHLPDRFSQQPYPIWTQRDMNTTLLRYWVSHPLFHLSFPFLGGNFYLQVSVIVRYFQIST